jgi:hypothetical protein
MGTIDGRPVSAIDACCKCGGGAIDSVEWLAVRTLLYIHAFRRGIGLF